MAHNIIGGGGSSMQPTFAANVYSNYGYGSSGSATASTTPVYMSDYDITITKKDGTRIRVVETLELLLDKLSIIVENQEKNEKYPALKEAYMNYKLVEKMLQGDDNDK